MDAVALQALRDKHPHGLQGKHKQAMFAKNKELYSGHLPRAAEKKGGHTVIKNRSRSCVHKLSCSVRSKEL